MRAVCAAPSAPLFFSRGGFIMQDEILFGQTADIYDERRGVCRAETFYGYRGFVHRSAFLAGGEISAEWHALQKSVVSAPFAAITALPTAQSRLVINVPRASILAPCGEPHGGFVKIMLPGGELAYAENALLRRLFLRKSADELRAAVCQNALSYVGCQYVWGGKTPMGIDCSGLASVSFLMEGVVIYRDAKLVPGFAAKQIEIKDVKAGDLLYFPGHIAVYLGGGKFVHSTNYEKTRGVCVAGLLPENSGYRPDLKAVLYAAASVAGTFSSYC